MVPRNSMTIANGNNAQCTLGEERTQISKYMCNAFEHFFVSIVCYTLVFLVILCNISHFFNSILITVASDDYMVSFCISNTCLTIFYIFPIVLSKIYKLFIKIDVIGRNGILILIIPMFHGKKAPPDCSHYFVQ